MGAPHVKPQHPPHVGVPDHEQFPKKVMCLTICILLYINLYGFPEVCGGQETLLDMSGGAILYVKIKTFKHTSKNRFLVTKLLHNQLPEVLTIRIEVSRQDT